VFREYIELTLYFSYHISKSFLFLTSHAILLLK